MRRRRGFLEFVSSGQIHGRYKEGSQMMRHLVQMPRKTSRMPRALAPQDAMPLGRTQRHVGFILYCSIFVIKIFYLWRRFLVSSSRWVKRRLCERVGHMWPKRSDSKCDEKQAERCCRFRGNSFYGCFYIQERQGVYYYVAPLCH